MPQEGAAILEQIKALIQQFLAVPYDDPLKPVMSGLLAQIDSSPGAGELSAIQAGGEPSQAGGMPLDGTAPEALGQSPAQSAMPVLDGVAPEGQGPEGDIVEGDEAPAKDYETARARGVRDLEAKGQEQQPQKRKRRG